MKKSSPKSMPGNEESRSVTNSTVENIKMLAFDLCTLSVSDGHVQVVVDDDRRADVPGEHNIDLAVARVERHHEGGVDGGAVTDGDEERPAAVLLQTSEKRG